MEMVNNMKHTLILIALILEMSASARAADFKLDIGSPVAAGVPGTGTAQVSKVKDGVFAVRTEGCADASKAQITATAEGLVNGMRQSVSLHLLPGAIPGVYVVSHEWPPQGAWVVNVSGTCANAKAGALVPIGPSGFLRDSSKFFPRSTTEAEIAASLKSLTGDSR
jgi:hypothetical protein